MAHARNHILVFLWFISLSVRIRNSSLPVDSETWDTQSDQVTVSASNWRKSLLCLLVEAFFPLEPRPLDQQSFWPFLFPDTLSNQEQCLKFWQPGGFSFLSYYSLRLYQNGAVVAWQSIFTQCLHIVQNLCTQGYKPRIRFLLPSQLVVGNAPVDCTCGLGRKDNVLRVGAMGFGATSSYNLLITSVPIQTQPQIYHFIDIGMLPFMHNFIAWWFT